MSFQASRRVFTTEDLNLCNQILEGLLECREILRSSRRPLSSDPVAVSATAEDVPVDSPLAPVDDADDLVPSNPPQLEPPAMLKLLLEDDEPSIADIEAKDYVEEPIAETSPMAVFSDFTGDDDDDDIWFDSPDKFESDFFSDGDGFDDAKIGDDDRDVAAYPPRAPRAMSDAAFQPQMPEVDTLVDQKQNLSNAAQLFEEIPDDVDGQFEGTSSMGKTTMGELPALPWDPGGFVEWHLTDEMLRRYVCFSLPLLNSVVAILEMFKHRQYKADEATRARADVLLDGVDFDSVGGPDSLIPSAVPNILSLIEQTAFSHLMAALISHARTQDQMGPESVVAVCQRLQSHEHEYSRTLTAAVCAMGKQKRKLVANKLGNEPWDPGGDPGIRHCTRVYNLYIQLCSESHFRSEYGNRFPSGVGLDSFGCCLGVPAAGVLHIIHDFQGNKVAKSVGAEHFHCAPRQGLKQLAEEVHNEFFSCMSEAQQPVDVVMRVLRRIKASGLIFFYSHTKNCHPRIRNSGNWEAEDQGSLLSVPHPEDG